MSPYFITATGTGIGKTLVTCALAHQLLQQGRRVRALKPVISGFSEAQAAQTDTGFLLSAQAMPVTHRSLEALSPWRFAAPISPDMAAAEEGKTIDFEQLLAFCRPQADEEYRLVEGVGGVMVPLDMCHTVLDWVAALRFPVILVAGSYLGSLSHTLTSAHAILSAGLTLHAVVVCESENPPVPLSRTQAALRRFLPAQTILSGIARLDSSPELWKYVPDLTHLLFV